MRPLLLLALAALSASADQQAPQLPSTVWTAQERRLTQTNSKRQYERGLAADPATGVHKAAAVSVSAEKADGEEPTPSPGAGTDDEHDDGAEDHPEAHAEEIANDPSVDKSNPIEVAQKMQEKAAEAAAARSGDGAGESDALSPLYREFQVCANGLRSWSTDYQERASIVTTVAAGLAQAMRDLVAAGIPLHKTFVYNMNLLQLVLFRVGWWAAAIVTSPYFQAYSLGVTQLSQYAADARFQLMHKTGKLGVRAVYDGSLKRYFGLLKKWRSSTEQKAETASKDLAASAGAVPPLLAPATALRSAAAGAGAYGQATPVLLDAHARAASEGKKTPLLAAPYAAMAGVGTSFMGPALATTSAVAAPIAMMQPSPAPAVKNSLADVATEGKVLAGTYAVTNLPEYVRKYIPKSMGGLMDSGGGDVAGDEDGTARSAKMSGKPVSSTTAGYAAPSDHSLEAEHDEEDEKDAEGTTQEETEEAEAEDSKEAEDAEDAEAVEEAEAAPEAAQEEGAPNAALDAAQAELAAQPDSLERMMERFTSRRRHEQAQTESRRKLQRERKGASFLELDSEHAPEPKDAGQRERINQAVRQIAAALRLDAAVKKAEATTQQQQQVGPEHLPQPPENKARMVEQTHALTPPTATAAVAAAPANGSSALIAGQLPPPFAPMPMPMPNMSVVLPPPFTLPAMSPLPMPPTSVAVPDAVVKSVGQAAMAPYLWWNSLAKAPGAKEAARKKAAEKYVKQMSAVTNLRSMLSAAGDGISDMNERSSAMSDQQVCIKNSLGDLISAGAYVPKWVLAVNLRIDVASRVLWQLWTLMMISKGSGYELSSHLLRSVMLYLNTQWQAVVANSAQATGPYSSMDWLPSDTYDKALWG